MAFSLNCLTHSLNASDFLSCFVISALITSSINSLKVPFSAYELFKSIVTSIFILSPFKIDVLATVLYSYYN